MLKNKSIIQAKWRASRYDDGWRYLNALLPPEVLEEVISFKRKKMTRYLQAKKDSNDSISES
jgi:hypothetical protein